MECTPLEERLVEALKKVDQLYDERARVKERSYRAGWNAALEHAALIVCPEPQVEEERECTDIAAMIRKWKEE